ncbi:MAG: CdaR family protein [Anaerolineales bacterium]|jgi:YbbR domain-containing protein
MKQAWGWLVGNLPSFVLALVLAVVVWFAAVSSADPNETRTLGSPVPIQITGLAPNLIAHDPFPQQATVTLLAPQSVWTELTSANIQVVADLSGLGPGAHEIPLQVKSEIRPVLVERIDPGQMEVALEPPASKTMEVQIRLSGIPAAGYSLGTPVYSPDSVEVRGGQSEVETVASVVGSMDVGGVRTGVNRQVALQALNAAGQAVSDVTLDPSALKVSISVQQQGGYRDVVVKAVIQGQVESGYRLTGISVYPPTATLFSADPSRVSSLPGYIETAPLDISGAHSDVSSSLALLLPAGVNAVGSPLIFVQVSVSAIQDSETFTRNVRYQGQGAGLAAVLSPSTVDVVISGPVPLLKALTPSDVDVYLDLSGLKPGTYQLQPTCHVLLEGLQIEALLPSQIGVVLAPGPVPTP